MNRPGEMEMMRNSLLWPNLVLPLKKGSGREIGILIGDGPNVYLKNMFDPKPLDEVHKKTYSSYEDLIADGWQVD